ncbi:hypothetical protein M6B22_10755 [Jatrophihabitans cynanchi]|uniref:DoxX family membrane protein n=1 Tax=Jatrophihabitans cynanchi TaxID=2944128 RepID=A0ABY7K5S2_9ACTN|nr:hypothetical protein [Jatrophihabitans sp. SB3-54]WAX59218.1 hypothetical protein M6B22_10755 [Jatrophihabitans sp. SB3-54]
MTSTATPAPAVTPSVRAATGARLRSDPTFQAYWLMRIGFTIVPILFGADKFAHVMVNWDKYLAPDVQRWLSPFDTVHQSMFAVGAIEIVAGLVVLLLPRIGGYVVALWLAGIVVNLAMIGGYWDIMMRDVALFLLALTFTRLASAFPAGAVSDRLLSRTRRAQHS